MLGKLTQVKHPDDFDPALAIGVWDNRPVPASVWNSGHKDRKSKVVEPPPAPRPSPELLWTRYLATHPNTPEARAAMEMLLVARSREVLL